VPPRTTGVDSRPMNGTIALVGSGEFTPSMEAVDRALLLATGRDRPRVVVLPTASWPDGEETFRRWAAQGEAHFAALGAEVEPVLVRGAEDADDPGNFRPRSEDPAGQAAGVFAAFLGADGIHVTGQDGRQKAAPHAASVAAVSSPPLAAVVGWMLRESNNVIAENLARQVALRERRPASFSGAAASVTAVLRRLGVPGGVHLVDGSGLSPQDRIAPAVLAHLVSLASADTQGRLRAVITGMPVAGFSGTLAPGGSVFSGFSARSRGLVRAKTGNLSSVATLAGLVYDASGRMLAFAFMTDQVRPVDLGKAAGGLDRMASALAGCGCRGR